MPNCNLPQSPSAANDTPLDAQDEFEVERRCLINNIAFLVVRQHRRRQLDVDESESESAYKACHKV